MLLTHSSCWWFFCYVGNFVNLLNRLPTSLTNTFRLNHPLPTSWNRLSRMYYARFRFKIFLLFSPRLIQRPINLILKHTALHACDSNYFKSWEKNHMFHFKYFELFHDHDNQTIKNVAAIFYLFQRYFDIQNQWFKISFKSWRKLSVSVAS